VGHIRAFLNQSILAFVAGALMLPGAIAFATVLLVLTAPGDGGRAAHWNSFLNRTPARACLYGALLGIGFCVLLGVLVCRRFTRASSACPGQFDQLHQVFDQATNRVEAVCTPAGTTDASGLCAEAREYLDDLAPVFERPSQVGLPWLLGSGYLNAWRRLHAADEAILRLEPVALLLGNAFADEARLEGSSIPQSTALLKRLRLAVFSLSQTASRYLIEAPSGVEPTDPAEARAALVQVRSAISEFRDSRREGLLRARNRLFATVVFAGITGCVLLDVAILSGAPKRSIAAVAAFYLVGGVVGLVRQLQTASASEGAAQDDFGLAGVRLVHTPLFSGLAAVGGVVLVKLTQGQTTFSLGATFDLDANPYGLVAAAFFGLTPALLLSSLQNRIEQYKTDLSKSASSDSHPSGSG
jgi:hypothetical protein